MKIYRENILENESFLIVSFFTQSYKKKAERLIGSLDRLNLNYKVFEIPTIHYSKSEKGSEEIDYCMPKLILTMIENYKIPIIFIDCDLIFVKEPKLFYTFTKEQIDFAIYNWLNDSENDGYLPIKLKVKTDKGDIENTYYINGVSVNLLNSTNKEEQLFSSGAVAYFSNTKESINLLKEWIKNIIKYPKAPDDQLLDFTFNYSASVRKNLKFRWFDKSYCRIYWWIFSDPVINHPGHVTHRKNDKFSLITGKDRFKLNNTISRYHSKISKDFLIDIKEKNILKVEKGKIYIVKKLTEEIYI